MCVKPMSVMPFMVASDTCDSSEEKDLSERMLDMPTEVPGTAIEMSRTVNDYVSTQNKH